MVTAHDAAAEGVVWEETPCPLCGASDARELLAVPGEAAGNVYRVAQCRRCDMAYLNPRPNRASIGRFYADDYHPYQAPRRERSAFARRLQRLVCARAFGDPPPRTRWSDKVLAALATPWLHPGRDSLTAIPFHGEGRLLDFGCGSGWYAKRMSDRGWTVTALDFNPVSLEQVARRVRPAHAGRLAAAPGGRRRQLRRGGHGRLAGTRPLSARGRRGDGAALRPGGLLVAVVPNFAAVAFRWFGADWWPLDLPRHLLHFTPATLGRLMTMHGLEAAELRPIPHGSSMRRSLANRRRRRGGSAALTRMRIVASLMTRWTAWLGRGDRLRVVAPAPASWRGGRSRRRDAARFSVRGEARMSAAVLLVCAAALGQPPEAPAVADNPPPGIPGVVVSQPLNIFYQLPVIPGRGASQPPGAPSQPPAVPSQPPGAPAQQAGVKTPSPETPSPEEAQRAAEETTEQPTSNQPPWYSLHGQATFVYQGNFPFHDPYDGPNSAVGRRMNDQTATGTLYFDVRPWQGGEIVFDPEFSGGTGLDGTVGFAGFPNGEATRVGVLEPTAYIARRLYRHTFEFDGEWQNVEDAANQIAGPLARDRLQISVGKMSAEDVLDDNVYSHDPRTQFLNWSIMYTGAWDYPANTRGYTYGALFDYTTMFYAVRYGIFAEPTDANGPEFDPHFLKAHGQFLEFEEDFILGDHPLRMPRVDLPEYGPHGQVP